jgi:hypothetical protein
VRMTGGINSAQILICGCVSSDAQFSRDSKACVAFRADANNGTDCAS